MFAYIIAMDYLPETSNVNVIQGSWAAGIEKGGSYVEAWYEQYKLARWICKMGKNEKKAW